MGMLELCSVPSLGGEDGGSCRVPVAGKCLSLPHSLTLHPSPPLLMLPPGCCLFPTLLFQPVPLPSHSHLQERGCPCQSKHCDVLLWHSPGHQLEL